MLDMKERQLRQLLTEEIDRNQRATMKFVLDLAEANARAVSAEAELNRNLKSHEDEVSLRLKFEDKLNELHNMY